MSIVKIILYVNAITICGLITYHLSNDSFTIEQENRAIYCEMTEIYKKTGGDYGWPPFDGDCE